MSFPRAKIQRFNEAPSCSPAPGTYDPKLDSKVKAPMMRKDSRQMSEGDLINGCSVLGTPKPVPAGGSAFRTPQLPRKVFKNGGKFQAREKCDSTSSVGDVFQRRDDCSLYQDISDFDSLKERLKNSIDELKKSKDLCELLNADIAGKMHQIDQLQFKNEELAFEITTLQNELERVHTEHHLSLTKFETLDRGTLFHLEEIHSMVNDLIDKKDISFNEMLKLSSEIDSLASLKHDLEQKVAQKQQMILLLQGELSTAEVELVECKSECERQSASASERAQEVKILKTAVENLEHKMEETDVQLRQMRDNLMNGSVVRETLEEQLTEKEAAYSDLETKFLKLLSECEGLKEDHSKDIDQIVNGYNKQLNDVIQYLEITSNFMRSKTLSMQDLCNEKLHALEDKLACTIEKSQEIWHHEIVHLRKELKIAADELKEEQFIACEKIRFFTKEMEEREEISSKRLQEVQSEARIITEKLLRAEGELKILGDIKDELKVSDMENKITIVELQDKVDSLTVERDSCNVFLSEMIKECDILKSQNKKLTVGNRNLNDSLEALRVRLLESESDVEEMAAIKCALESDKRNLELALEGKLHELEEQKTNITKIEAENLQQIEKVREHLLEKLESFKQKALISSENLQKFEAGKNKEIQNLSIQLEHFQHEFEELNIYVASMEEENEKQVQKLQNYQEQQKVLEESFKSVTAKYEQQTAELQQCKNELVNAQGKIALQQQIMLEHKCHIEKLTLDIENSEARISELNEALCMMEETNAEHEREIEALVEKLDHQQECAKVATQQIANLEAVKSYQEHQLQSLTSELESQNEVSQKASENILLLINSNTEKDQRLEGMTEEMAELKNNYNEFTEQLDRLKEELSSEQMNLKSSADEIKLLEGDRFVKEEQLKELSSELEKQKECVLKYSAENTILKDKKLKTEDEIINLKHKVDVLEQKNTMLEETTNKLMVNLKDSEHSNSIQNENARKDIESFKKQIKDLLNIKSDLELELYELKRKCDSLENSLANEKSNNTELLNRLSSMDESLKVNETQCLALRANITSLNVELSVKQNEAQNSISQLKKKMAVLEEENLRLICFEDAAAEWKRKYQEVECLIGPFKEQLQAYSTECKMLEAEKGQVQKDMRELSLQYAATLGHQNMKQKIRYLVKIKDENLELKEEVRKLKRTIEKVRKDDSHSSKSASASQTPLKSKGKENILSANHSPVGKSPVGSPNPKPFADRSAHKNVI